MRYKIRPGIVRTKICDVWLLIPTREASEDCPHIMKLTLLSSIVWETIEKGKPMEDAVRAFRILLKKPDDMIHVKIQRIIDKFCEDGFLICEEDMH